jgi:hypothetical protein
MLTYIACASVSPRVDVSPQYMSTQIVCLIDGDGFIFTPELLCQGQQGGRIAARTLAESIRAHLHSEIEQLDLWVYIFCNKRGLVEALARAGHPDAKTHFDDFVIGFNQAGERFLMVDVGSGKEAADAKIKSKLYGLVSKRNDESVCGIQCISTSMDGLSKPAKYFLVRS